MANINIKVTDEQLTQLKQKKLDMQSEKKLKKLTWDDAVLLAFGVKK